LTSLKGDRKKMSELELDELKNLKEEYVTLAGKIASANGLAYQGKLRVSTVMKILADHECERLIIHLLRNPDVENNKFDRYYSEKHEFCKRKLVERLKNKLEGMGRRVSISTEMKSDTGRYDLIIVSGQQIKILDENGKEKIVIEIKASLGIDLFQIERYLWDDLTLIIVRVVTSHVKKIKTVECLNFLLESLRDLAKKANRILANKPIVVPRRDCCMCQDMGCKYNENNKTSHFHRIVMGNEEFKLDMDELFKNIYTAIDEAVEMVAEELEGSSKDPGDQVEADVKQFENTKAGK
jgi:hypothetical protein